MPLGPPPSATFAISSTRWASFCSAVSCSVMALRPLCPEVARAAKEKMGAKNPAAWPGETFRALAMLASAALTVCRRRLRRGRVHKGTKEQRLVSRPFAAPACRNFQSHGRISQELCSFVPLWLNTARLQQRTRQTQFPQVDAQVPDVVHDGVARGHLAQFAGPVERAFGHERHIQ